MTLLSKVNPASSLFFRVFLWFWLAALLIFISSIWLVQQLESSVKYSPLKAEQKRELEQTVRKFQFQVDKNNVDLIKQANQLSKRNRFHLILLNPRKNKVLFGLNKSQEKTRQLIEPFSLESSALAMETDGVVITGPRRITKKNVVYLLFISEPQSGGFLRVVRYEYPELFLFLLIFLSGILCYLFVRSLLNPIVQLQKAAKLMASGDLAARVDGASHRMDEIGQLSRDFNSMSEKVELLLNGQKRLLADISHELRSPLARLQLSIGIAQQQKQIAKNVSLDQQLALDRIEKEAGQIESMIAQVLTLSRLDNQQTAHNRQVISLTQLMSPIIEDAQFEAIQKMKTVHYICAVETDLFVDPQLLGSAIENILRNAIHYSKSIIDVEVSIDKAELFWVINDDGDGMDEEQLKRIFEPFYRSATARDRNSGGVGLGLAIAFQAIEQHQGNITTINRATGGLEVRVTVPLNRFD